MEENPLDIMFKDQFMLAKLPKFLNSPSEPSGLQFFI